MTVPAGSSGRLYVRQLQLGPMQNFVYLLGAEGSREVAIVDPAWEVEQALERARADGKELVAALLTHHHFDHVNGVEPLLEKLPGLRVHAQRAELERSRYLRELGVEAVGPGDRVEVGPLRISCVHTPGHTPGSQCFHVEDHLVSGDTLFVGACGRCDLEGGDVEAMYDSLHRILGAMPGSTVLLPGHDYGDRPVTTLASERETNPYLVASDVGSFVRHRTRPRS